MCADLRKKRREIIFRKSLVKNKVISAPYHVAEEKLLTIFRHLWEGMPSANQILVTLSVTHYLMNFVWLEGLLKNHSHCIVILPIHVEKFNSFSSMLEYGGILYAIELSYKTLHAQFSWSVFGYFPSRIVSLRTHQHTNSPFSLLMTFRLMVPQVEIYEENFCMSNAGWFFFHFPIDEMHSIDKVDLVVVAAQARQRPLWPQSLDYYKPRLIVHEVKMLTPKAKPDALDATIPELI